MHTGDIRQQFTAGRTGVYTHAALLKQGAGFSGRNKYRTRSPSDSGGPRGTRGFIFPWLRFNSAALIWLRVFVRVSNDLQRAASEPSRPMLFFLFACFLSPTLVQCYTPCRWIKVRYFSICRIISVEPHNVVVFFFFFFFNASISNTRKNNVMDTPKIQLYFIYLYGYWPLYIITDNRIQIQLYNI